MAYRLLRHESIEESLRRIAREQIDKALVEVGPDGLERDVAVHQVRKRCKKIRGLLRLGGSKLGKSYKLENAHYRDVAALLSTTRDSAALIEAHDELMRWYARKYDLRPVEEGQMRRDSNPLPTAYADAWEIAAGAEWHRPDHREMVRLADDTARRRPFAGRLQVADGGYPRSIDLFSEIRTMLALRQKELFVEAVDVDEQIAAFLARMSEGRRRVSDWTLGSGGFSAVRRGLARTYGRGRKAMFAARNVPSEKTLHEWRTRVKYHWYQVRLIQDIWSPLLRQRRNELKRLAEYLGDDHDLARLGSILSEEPSRFGDTRRIAEYLRLLHKRRRQFQSRSWTLGARLFAEKPDALTDRFECYWRAWHHRARGGRT